MGLLLSQVARFRGAQVKYVHGPLKIDRNLTDGIKRYEIETSFDSNEHLFDFLEF